eukprot:359082-Chlamydomonas_euryale.AAC.1
MQDGRHQLSWKSCNTGCMSCAGFLRALAAAHNWHCCSLTGTLYAQHGGRDRHFCTGVEDIEPLIGRLDEAGIEYTRSMSGRPAVFFRDPGGLFACDSICDCA